MKNKYIVDIKYEETFDATVKARSDINDILVKSGFKLKYLNLKKANNYLELYKNVSDSYKQLVSILDNMEENSTFFFQYPWDSLSYKFAKTIHDYQIKKNIKTIVFVHDIDSIRSQSFFGRLYYKKYVKEFKFINEFEYVICSNYSMKKFLVENGVDKNKIVEFIMFDYLCSDKNVNDLANYKKIAIAGNLSNFKSAYIYDLCSLDQDVYDLELYGVNFKDGDYKRVNYNGVFSPTELVDKINGGFGLIWDGTSIDKLEGSFGVYEYYNTPHKLSLYMASGVPVIVCKKAAISKIVLQYGIGIVVDNLRELPSAIEKISKNDYKTMVKNVNIISKKVREGYFILDAIKKCR